MAGFLDAAPLWLPGAIAMLGLVFVSGFFSASETALFYLSRDELRALEHGRPRERRAAMLLRDPERLLTGLLFCNLVTNLTFFAVSVVTARRLLHHEQGAAAGLFSVISVALIITFGEVLPKGAAVLFRRRVAVLFSTPLSAALRAVDPIVPPLAGTARALRSAVWPRLGQEPYLDVDDLERAIESLNVGADLIRHEQQVLQNVLDLSDRTVEEVMRPRGTYLVWKPPVSLDQVRGKLAFADYLYVRDDEPDAIAGVVPLQALSTLPAKNIDAAAEPVVHVPWCATLANAFEQMRDEPAAVAVVVNEYGETTGIVTYEDILDTILAPQPSRARRILRREPVLEIETGRYEVDGLTTLRYLAQRLNVEYEPTVDGLLSVTGLLQDSLERLPEVGDDVAWHGWRVHVIEASPRGLVRVLVERPEKRSPPEGGHAPLA